VEGIVGVQGFGYDIGHNGTNTARITGVLVKDAAVVTPLDANTEYLSFSLVINRAKTLGADACDGCSEEVCVVLNEIKVWKLAGDSTLTLNHPRDRNFVSWQGGQSNCPPAYVSTRNRTWGRVKSIYR